MRKGQIYRRCEICKKPLDKVDYVSSHGFTTKDIIPNHIGIFIIARNGRLQDGSVCSAKCKKAFLESLKEKAW